MPPKDNEFENVNDDDPLFFSDCYSCFRPSNETENAEKKTMSIKAAEVPLVHVMKKEQPSVKSSFLFVIALLQFYSSYHVKPNVISLSKVDR